MNKTQNESYESIIKKSTLSVFALKKTYPAYIILVMFIAASFFVKYFVSKNIETGLSNEFNSASTSVMNRLSAHYYKQIEVLNSMNGLYDTLVEVVKDYFELYATIPTRSYSSILSVSYIPEVEHSDLDKFIINARGLGYFNYELKSDEVKDTYYPFINMVPEFSNYHRLGVDLGVEQRALTSILRAKEKNIMTSTDVYEVRKPDTLGLYIFYPVYFRGTERETREDRIKNFQAVLSLEINISQFIKEALSGEGMEQKIVIPGDSTIFFEMIGTNDDGERYSVFKSDNYIDPETYSPILSTSDVFRVADKKFTVHFYSVPGYGGKIQEIMPNLSLAISLVLSFAFFGFVLTQMTNKARAVEIADRMTKSQRRILDSSNDVIAVLDEQLTWKSMNPASYAIFGIIPSEMTDTKFLELLSDKNDINLLLSKYQSSTEGQIEKFDLKMLHKSKGEIWINWSFTFSAEDKLIYCVGRDVTLQKLAEAEAVLQAKQIETAGILEREANFSKSLFLKQTSHQLRNSLTGIFGSLQVIQHKLFDSAEEHDMFIDIAASSSEELYTYITDMEDAAKLSEPQGNSISFDNLSLKNIIGKVSKSLFDDVALKMDSSNLKLSDSTNFAHVIGDENTIVEVLSDALKILSSGQDNIRIEINTEINSYEGAVEIQILSTANPIVHNMIEIYMNERSNIIKALRKDQNDILMMLVRITSNMRMLSGSFKVDSFGADEGNLISLVFKSNKKSI